MKARTGIILASAVLLSAACQSIPGEGERAHATLSPTKGNRASGQATFVQSGGKVRLTLDVQGLKPGQEHGFHIHEAGDCSSGDGMSAKGHFNPHGKPHAGPSNPERHAGDLPSLKADGSGRAHVEVELDAVTVAAGPTSVIGRGLIVHADPDDFKTQPTGNSGARIACGVIARG